MSKRFWFICAAALLIRAVFPSAAPAENAMRKVDAREVVIPAGAQLYDRPLPYADRVTAGEQIIALINWADNYYYVLEQPGGKTLYVPRTSVETTVTLSDPPWTEAWLEADAPLYHFPQEPYRREIGVLQGQSVCRLIGQSGGYVRVTQGEKSGYVKAAALTGPGGKKGARYASS